MEMINGATIVLETLKRLGVSDMFGYPGGYVIPIYDALYDFEGINHVFTRHEQGAAHAADAYARSSGKIGVCLATSGPGATNLITGIMTAYMDSIPMLAITGQVPVSFLGKDAFQESNIVGITMPITKHNYLIKSIKDLPRILKEAVYVATTGRPGPVVVDLPKCVQLDELSLKEFNRLYDEPINMSSYSPNYVGHPNQIRLAAKAIKDAKKPLIISGGGTIKANASKELVALAEKIDTPVAMTSMGLGSISPKNPLCLKMLGMHGTVYANFAARDADLVIAVGVRFNDRITGDPKKFLPNAKIIHIDIDPAEINKNKMIDIPIVGDAQSVLGDLIERVDKKENTEWRKVVEGWKKQYPLTYKKDPNCLKPQQVIQKISEIVDGKAIVTTDVGQHQMWSTMYYDVENPRDFISSLGAGTMGFGIPAALGAQVARPNDRVIAIVGDGGAQMTAQEIMTFKQYNLPVKVVVINNSYLGMVRQWQELFMDKRYSSVNLSLNPDFVKMAESYRIKGVLIDKEEDLEEKLRENLLSDEPVLIECVVTNEENVFPMIPSGKNVDSLIGEKGEL